MVAINPAGTGAPGRGQVIVRVKGGLGNQLSAYAAARRLALVNEAELVIDDTTGFIRDTVHRRRYLLDGFKIPARTATASERLEPLERYRRAIMRRRSQGRPFDRRDYVTQDRRGFDPRMLARRVDGRVYLDGLWHGEAYFGDVSTTVRSDLTFVEPTDASNQATARSIREEESSVAVHVRNFDAAREVGFERLEADYYRRAFELVDANRRHPHYFVFSDDPDVAGSKLANIGSRVTLVTHNSIDAACADMWLFSLCRDAVIANSTFSWWGAWLGDGSPNRLVISPNSESGGRWAARGQIPAAWLRI